MDRKKKFFQKRRKVVNSVFSWLLVFAMIISSVSAVPGAVMTARAAENEAGEEAIARQEESGVKVEDDIADAGDDTDSAGEGTDTSSEGGGADDSGADTEPDGTGSTPGTGEGADPENSGTKPEDGADGSGIDGETSSEEDTGADTGDAVTDEAEDGAGETPEEDGGTAGEDDEEPGGSGTVNILDNGERIAEVDVTLHFYNALDWNPVTIHYWGDGVTGTTWPGESLTGEGDGWYTITIKASTGSDIQYLIDNGTPGDGTSVTLQTADAVIPAAELGGGDTYEIWTWLRKDSMSGEKYNVLSSTVHSPEVNGGTVTFRYKNDSAATVSLAGTMNEWSADADVMEKGADGTFTYEKELAHGEHQYKFVVDGEWNTDPSNPLYVTEKSGNENSLVYVPGDTLYNYTVHYYDPAHAEQDADVPDLYVWELGIEYAKTDKFYTYESKEEDANGISWLTTTFSVPYRNLGIIGRPAAGSWDEQDANRSYQLAGGTGAELWYIYGKGIYDKKPVFGDVKEVTAAMYYPSMDCNRNNVLTLTVNGSEDGADLVAEACVDASALGMSDKLAIDPELLEVSLAVTEETAPGSYTLPVTVIGNNGSKAGTTVTVSVEPKAESDDFDWDEAVIYFMVTDRFFDGDSTNNAANGGDAYGTNAGLYHGGDFAGVTQKLDYLDELGVNTIWITPIVENIKGVTVNGEGKEDVPYNAAYHGYWASDFTRLNPALGTDTEFQALIDAAHAKGMKIMVDVVLNHAGYGAEENFPGMLRDKAVDESDFVHGGGQANLPDFLTENAEVRDQLIAWQVNWADKGVDYFRVDTVKHVDSTTWMAFKNALTKAKPEFKMIGEYYGAGYASENGGTLGSGQMDSLLDFDFNDWALAFVSGSITSVEQNLAKRNAALNNTYLTGQFLSSHDEDGFKHRLGNNISDKDGAAMVAATLQITAKGQPVIYYGEEIGLTGANNYPYQTNRYDFDWSEVESGSNRTYTHYRKMLAIREQYSEIFAKGDRSVVAGSDREGYDVISRSYNGETVYVAMNIGADAKEISIPVDSSGITKYTDLYGAKSYQVEADGRVTLTIPSAADGGTVVLAAGGFVDTLVAPELTIAKGTNAAGKVSALPYRLTHVAQDGTKTPVDVFYNMNAVEGVTLDGTGCRITVNQAFTGDEVTLTATAKEDERLSVTFAVKVVEDKNEITLRLHYTRPDGNYGGWNVWAWTDRMAGSGYEFDTVGENGEKVATFVLKARETGYLNYIIRKSVTGNDWLDKDVKDDQEIDLTDVLSGTVDYYVEAGVNGGRRVLGDDVLLGAKVISAVYNRKNNTVKAVTGMPVVERPDDAFMLKSADGKEVPVTGVSVSTNKKEYTLSLGADLSQAPAIAKEYYLGFDGYDYAVEMPQIYSTEEFEEKYAYDGNDLGASWSREKTIFRVWAPTAEAMKVNLYESGTEGTEDLIESIEMTMGEKGVWSAERAGDLNGTYYTYTAVQDGKESEACDPYARTTGVNGNRAMVIDLDSTDPEGWANDRGPNQGMSYNDSVIYELHVRDFSIDASSGISDVNKGKFLGLTEKSTTNATGQTTGLDYLKNLGVTHLHLLPVYDYATVDETKLDTPQFNWGYDPKNYNTPEGSYATDPYNGAVRVKEMKQMVKTLHDNNINVIMDVVYNHVYDADAFCFNRLVPQYFSRTKADGSYSNGSGCGNDTASERAMVKKYIVDSVNYWADEYHIDGFRFDLVGLLDTETINEVVNTVHQKHPDVVFYGEGWTMDTVLSKDGYTMATQANSAKTPDFAFFSDTIRDAIKGNNFEAKNTGFVTGATGLEEQIAKCFTADTDWCKSPAQTVNYASCHDNYTLWDKISVSRSDASVEERIRMNNLAAAIYMTAEGIPLIHAGEEILRTKPSLNPTPENHGVEENSYNLPDSVNSIKWSDLDKEAYRNVRDYYKGLIEFRKNHAALRLTSAADVKANVRYHWITNEVVMFVIGGKDKIAGEISDGIVVIFNAAADARTVNLYQSGYGVAEGTWNIYINDQKAGIETLGSVTDGQVQVAPVSAMVLVKGEAKDQDSVYDKNELIKRKLQALKTLIATCEGLEQGSYTDESWKTFTDALAAAKTTAGKTGVTAEEIDSAMDQLQAAYDALKQQDDVPQGLWVKWDDESMFVQDEGGQDHITYTGKAIRPVICVYDGSKQLKEKTDYTVVYKQNINAGEAVVTVNGKGNYTQKLEKTFTIDKVDINTLVVADLYGIVAAGNTKPVQPKPVVKYNGRALRLKLDYTVGYQNPATDGKTPGVYNVILASNPNSKNFTGSTTIQMVLADKADAVLMSKVTIKKIPAQPYAWDAAAKRGKVQKPAVTVTHGRKTLTGREEGQQDQNWDYEVLYDMVHTEAGETATITVRGNGTRYFGTKTAAFKITGTPLKANKVSLKDVPKSGLIYTGSAQEPEVVIADAVSPEDGYKPYAVTYQKNTNVGTATVTVTGINGYTGTVKKTFRIVAYDILTNADGRFAFGEDNTITKQIPYAKGGSKLTDEHVDARFTDDKGNVVNLEQGKDYTLTYKRNTSAGTACVAIKGKGNYKGTVREIPFTIVPRDLGELAAGTVAGDILLKNAKKYNAVIPVITDLNGRKLQNRTDFTVDKATAYTYADGSAITETPAVGSWIKVTAAAKGGNYTGQVSATFRVIANDRYIASARVRIEPQKYTGAEVRPGREAVTVEMKVKGKWEEIDKSCFEITGYTNNVKKGTAKLTIHGTGEYGGSKTVSFRINAKPMILGTR